LNSVFDFVGKFCYQGKPPMNKTVRTVAAIYILSAMILIVVFYDAKWLDLRPMFRSALFEIGVALFAVGSIHILDHYSMIREVTEGIVRHSSEMFDRALLGATDKMMGDISGAISNASETIVSVVSAQTEEAFSEASQILQRQVKSIKVMEECNLVAIHSNRMKAADTIRAAIAESSEVWLMGVSLNEFCQSDGGPFMEAWEDLVKAIHAGTKKARLLLIDPYCHGAVLRSYAETVHAEGVSDRLENDVKAAARRLHQLRGQLGDRKADLEVRLCRLVPTMFLCRLDTVTFTQGYYFWKARIAGRSIPVFQYRKQVQSQGGVCIHTELGQHFDFIWRHASIPLDDMQPPLDAKSHFLPEPPPGGMEWGSHASGTENVFIDRSRAACRMAEEIAQSHRIWIQGITLKTFFDDASPLSKSLEKRILKQDADIRILLLDPDCEQAMFRAYREFLLNSGDSLSFDDFARNRYRNSTLRLNLQDTVGAIFEKHGNAGIQMKTYKTAPHMFLLIGDSGAFVEQYSYGKCRPTDDDEKLILGSDMPLVEYQREIHPIYARVLDNIRSENSDFAKQLRPQPHQLLVSHFEYAWKQADQHGRVAAEDE
jgi:hypothetical protein